jgi:hypothetical protein
MVICLLLAQIIDDFALRRPARFTTNPRSFADMTTKTTESQRVDWLLDNPGFSCTRNDATGEFSLIAWVCNGAPGNENGGGAKFCATSKTRESCVDKFIRGDIRSAT